MILVAGLLMLVLAWTAGAPAAAQAEAEPAEEVAAALARTNEAQSFRYLAVATLPGPLTLELSGAAVAPDRLSLAAALPAFGGVLPPSTLEAVIVGEVAYVRQTIGPPGTPPGGWTRLDHGSPARAAVGGVSSALSPAAVRGYVKTTHLLAELVAGGAAVVRGEPQEGADEPLVPYVIGSLDGAGSWNLQVGASSGFVRQLEWFQDGVTFSLSYFDYDAPLAIEPPG